MLLKFAVENFMAFSSKIELNLEADLRTQKFNSNIIFNPLGNSVKSLAIYGPNNTGKTCLLNAINQYKLVLLNKPFNIDCNLFEKSTVATFSSEFIWDSERYSYSFSYNQATEAFVEENLTQVSIDQHGNKSKKVLFYRNTENKKANSISDDLKKVIKFASKDNILINTLDTSNFELLKKAKELLRGFAESITVLSMQKPSPNKTIEVLKNPNSNEARQIVELIRSADLDIDNFMFDEKSDVLVNNNIENEVGKDKKESFTEMLKLISVHKGIPLPSLIYDSLGTRKFVSLAGYVIAALNNGGCLFVDEFDSGIHFKLSRAIVSLFNSVENTNCAQLVFSTHDVSLLDLKNLFRKEQIWFTHKDDAQVYLYPLSDFTAQNSGIRLESNLYDLYSKGVLGALPEPSLIDVLLMGRQDNCNE